MKVATIGVCATLVLGLALAAAVAGGIAPYLLAAAMSLVLGLGWASAVGIRARYRHSIIILLSGALAVFALLASAVAVGTAFYGWGELTTITGTRLAPGTALPLWLDPGHVYLFDGDGRLAASACHARAA